MWNATCQRPLPTLISESAFTPLGPLMWVPFAANSGGQTLAQAPVHVDPPAGSLVKRYSVRPDAVVSTVPMCDTLAVETVIVLA